MDKITHYSVLCISVVSGSIAYRLGGYDEILKALLFFIVIDFITGLLKSLFTKCLDSKVGFKGIIRKVIILIVVSVGVEIERITTQQFPIREMIIMFYISMEGISIIENCSYFIPMPDKLLDFFEQLKDNKKEEKRK